MAKKKNRRLGLILVAGIGIAAYMAYRLSTKIWVADTKLKKLTPTWEALTGTIVLEIENRSSTPIPIQGFSGEVLYNSISIADLRIGPSVIQPRTKTELPVDFRALWAELPTSIEQILRSGSVWPSFSVKGQLYAGNLTIPIRQNLQIV
ncbi:MAG: hypothetical protein KF852_04230 [Saprospiraceae bacterium]|nr:hypothetical protein [Saprospiraceae bacterium]